MRRVGGMETMFVSPCWRNVHLLLDECSHLCCIVLASPYVLFGKICFDCLLFNGLFFSAS